MWCSSICCHQFHCNMFVTFMPHCLCLCLQLGADSGKLLSYVSVTQLLPFIFLPLASSVFFFIIISFPPCSISTTVPSPAELLGWRDPHWITSLATSLLPSRLCCLPPCVLVVSEQRWEFTEQNCLDVFPGYRQSDQKTQTLHPLCLAFSRPPPQKKKKQDQCLVFPYLQVSFLNAPCLCKAFLS